MLRCEILQALHTGGGDPNLPPFASKLPQISDSSAPDSDPALPHGMRVRVPASTSNLGPGFDLVGLALELWLDVEAHPAEAGLTLGRLEGEAAVWPGKDNLLVRAFERGFRLAGAAGSLPALRLDVRSEIPLARGLGSSGAAIAGGLILGSAYARGGEALPPEQLAQAGAELEGHPDNSSASLFGGCTLALPAGDQLNVLRHELSPELAFALAWPTRPMSTAVARKALPAEVPFAAAMENPRRLAVG